MNVLDISTIQTTMDKSANWFENIQNEMNWDDPEKAYVGLRAVLHSLRDRVYPDEAIHLGSQLPMLIRGIYYEGWKYSDKPETIRDKEEFLDKIRNHYDNNTDIDPEKISKAVFSTLSKNISEGEMDHILNNLPKEWKDLWS